LLPTDKGEEPKIIAHEPKTGEAKAKAEMLESVETLLAMAVKHPQIMFDIGCCLLSLGGAYRGYLADKRGHFENEAYNSERYGH